MLSNIITENGLDLGIAASGSDLITVSQLPDVIVGGTGNSIISGDKGLDTLTGGGGANQFILQSSGTDRDVITDFKPGIDKMRLPAGVTFADLQVRGSGANTEILRNGEVVAILNGVMSSSINSNDFITAGQETSSTLPVSVEPGNTPETAGDLGLFSGIREFNNFVGTADNNDYYRFTLSEVHDVKLTLFGMSDDANLTLYVGDEKPDDSIKMGQQIATSNNSGTRDESITLPLGAGDYFVKVDPEYTTTNTRYALTLEATA